MFSLEKICQCWNHHVPTKCILVMYIYVNDIILYPSSGKHKLLEQFDECLRRVAVHEDLWCTALVHEVLLKTVVFILTASFIIEK